jgi:hypothetical protein
VTADVAVIGAGPYGLSAAAHLRHAGIETLVFGEPLVFWERNMPVGMLLRSSPFASRIAEPDGRFSLERYQDEHGLPRRDPLPRKDFIDYGRWIHRQLVPDVDRRAVRQVERASEGFRLTLEDGELVEARRVVVAGGIEPFARQPGHLGALPKSHISHSVNLSDVSRFAGSHVAVVGAGQSALESAALLHEADAEVEVLVRAPRIVWIPPRGPDNGAVRRYLRKAATAPTEVGPRGVSWIAAVPDVFRRLPLDVQVQIDRLAMTPMGSAWLRPRLRNVPISLGRTIVDAAVANEGMRLRLDDGTTREVDHLVAATGYRVDVRRYPFLGSDVVRALELVNGYPVLSPGFESSVTGLHFIGAPAAAAFGPVMRFVTGTWYAAPALTRRVLGRRPSTLAVAF